MVRYSGPVPNQSELNQNNADLYRLQSGGGGLAANRAGFYLSPMGRPAVAGSGRARAGPGRAGGQAGGRWFGLGCGVWPSCPDWPLWRWRERRHNGLPRQDGERGSHGTWIPGRAFFQFLSWLMEKHMVVATSHSARRKNYLMELQALSKQRWSLEQTADPADSGW